MATGFDKLLDFLLTEIALRGVQGASSKDFRQIIHTFYGGPQCDKKPQIDGHGDSGVLSADLGRMFYERMWQWVTNHPDIRIIYQKEARQYTLSEFEAAELHETGTIGATPSTDSIQPLSASSDGVSQPSKALSALGQALRQQVVNEGKLSKALAGPDSHDSATTLPRQWPRNVPGGPSSTSAVFDKPDPSITAPRLYASQNRIWQALTGHSIDLKKVPCMEFVLLSLIAARGAAGIPQPELVRISGQDKRSVPKRTMELARKGYIAKYEVQAGKARTSLCIHRQFISQNTFIGSSAVEDVYMKDGTFVVRNFPQLLYDKFGKGGVVPTWNIRKRLGVPMEAWNKRATQGALIRLDQSGMIKRCRVRKKKSIDTWITCIQVLREPRDEDLKNLGFRRTANVVDEAVNELLDEDVDGDTLMRDLEVDMLDADVEVDTQVSTHPAIDDSDRIPPQWTPDRFLANTVYDAVAVSGMDGCDAEVLRDRLVGPFWRRPIESYFTRLTEDWENTQPFHLRHLAVIRDQGVTYEKKFIHYLYRTFSTFQKAVDAGVARWEGVSNSKANEVTKTAANGQLLNAWGFPIVNPKDLFRGNGSATLSEAGSSVVQPRGHGPRWDIAVAEEIGYKRSGATTPKTAMLRAARLKKQAKPRKEPTARIARVPKPPKNAPDFSLTPEERFSLGLGPSARVTKNIKEQILAHRQKTGDPTSLPDQIQEGPAKRQLSVPLMTAEERVAAGLSARGRLGTKRENEIRKQRGLPLKVKKKAARKSTKEPTLLSKPQRIALGWTDHGRLPQAIIDGLREERENGIAIEDSKVIAEYMDFMRARATELSAKKNGATSNQKQSSPIQDPSTPGLNRDTENSTDFTAKKPDTTGLTSTVDARKRKAEDMTPSPTREKKRRTRQKALQRHAITPMRSQSPSSSEAIDSLGRGTPLMTPDEEHGGDANPTDAANPMYLVQHMPLPVEDIVAQSVEVQQSPGVVGKTYVQPDPSQLDSRDRRVFERYEMRKSSGLYLNPYVKQKLPRGRPRKALIATFKLSSLASCEWFSADQSQMQEPQRRSFATPEPSTKSTTHQVEAYTVQRHSSTADASLQSPLDTHPTTEIEAQQSVRDAGRLSSIATTNKPDLLSHRSEATVEVPVQPASPSRDASKPREPSLTAVANMDDHKKLEITPSINEAIAEMPTKSSSPSRGASQDSEPSLVAEAPIIESGDARLEIVSEEPERQPSRETARVPRTVGGWAPINASQHYRPAPYKSPYAAVVGPVAFPPSKTVNTATSNGGSSPITGAAHAPSSALDDTASLPEGVCSAIVEAQRPPMSDVRPRAKTRGPVGSLPHFRQDIIMEIIKRCNGVFPGDNAIIRPFETLWKERHKNLMKPAWSTITETLKAMVKKPAFGLKHWTFAVQNKVAPGTTQKHMYTWAHLTPKSPEVWELVRNMAQERSHQYYPKEVRHLASDSKSYLSTPEVPKDETIVLNQLNPELEEQISEAKKRRRSVLNKKYRLESKARQAQDAQVEQVPSKQLAEVGVASRTKRTRLASLNDKSKQFRRAPLQTALNDTTDEEDEDGTADEPEAVEAGRSRKTSLFWTNPIVEPVSEPEIVPEKEQSENEDSENGLADSALQDPEIHSLNNQDAMSVAQPPEVHHINHTLAAESESVGANEEPPPIPIEQPAEHSAVAQKGKKRVRIVAPLDQSSRKRARLASADAATIQHTEHNDDSNVENDVASVSEAEEKEEEDSEYSGEESGNESGDEEKVLQTKSKKRKSRAFNGRQRGKSGPSPTLLERLTGLTGDPNDPIYQPPERVSRPGRVFRPWSERKKKQVNKHKKERLYAEVVDPVDNFKKLFFTFVVVSSMSGEHGKVDWSLVQRVYATDRLFDLAKAQKLWAWMQINMNEQVNELTTTFQSLFLEAYETGKVAAIEDPETYDWSGLVRWAVRKCTYPELPLPILREALVDFAVEESSYESLDRVSWYKVATADRSRALLQLQHSFTAPLHRSRQATWSPQDKLLKARSWIRSNTATPQALYDANLAHEKFKDVGESVLVSVVGDFVTKQHLRMRKLKRLLPGRNYSFTKALAKKYTRIFQLDDFINAVNLKKRMDAAFADEDPNNRRYDMSRCEEDCSFAAIMTMVSEGTVKLLPQLPPVNSEFGAPLPRLSVWGFCEGDYIHRAIDRGRLFWDIHVVPTAKYKFGNPLQPLSAAPEPTVNHEPTPWPALPEPPLPGKHDANALLPIWSSIDGQSVTWPWWYRVLNIVLQPLIFMAGATAADIQAHCPEHTTELFEIELILGWLESINAVKKTVGGGYITLPGFWAAFGDQLHDTEDDWFGEHVKRKTKQHERQQWREDYNLRHAKLQARSAQQTAIASAEEAGAAMSTIQDTGPANPDTVQQILKNPKQQYRIMQQALDAQQTQAETSRPGSETLPSPVATHEQPDTVLGPVASVSQTSEPTSTPGEDVAMADADADADMDAEGEDIDAEGEIDDDMY
ncbi:hypothetical protein BDW02DRAFT_97278 [Decorospora gaudefroyi]|uniref:Uncharacterized protein n=1 Tax=Decorospora gaudefroyi TaxID=184978 RepID=A0A6A5KP67_9PLEO|nr:hypothetical protein BDW02DRAFT_97278 [Decorospora gaudefroyi]